MENIELKEKIIENFEDANDFEIFDDEVCLEYDVTDESGNISFDEVDGISDMAKGYMLSCKKVSFEI